MPPWLPSSAQNRGNHGGIAPTRSVKSLKWDAPQPLVHVLRGEGEGNKVIKVGLAIDRQNEGRLQHMLRHGVVNQGAEEGAGCEAGIGAVDLGMGGEEVAEAIDDGFVDRSNDLLGKVGKAARFPQEQPHNVMVLIGVVEHSIEEAVQHHQQQSSGIGIGIGISTDLEIPV